MVKDSELKRVILMPFCVEAVLMYHKLKKIGCEVAGFFDNNVFIALEDYDGECVMLPYYIPNTKVVVCHDKHMDSIVRQMHNMSYETDDLIDWREIDTRYNNVDICEDVDLKSYQKKCPREAIWDSDSLGRNGTIIIKELRAFRQKGVEYSYKGKYHTIPFHDQDYSMVSSVNLPRFRDNTESPLFTIDNCDLKITDVCTLRCKYCSVLLDYPVERKEIPLTSIVNTLNQWLNRIDYARRMTLLGGEPFTYSHIKELLAFISDNKLIERKVGILYLYTNATIVPDDDICQLLHDAGVFVVISGYTTVRTRIEEFVKKMNTHRVFYMIAPMGENWFDMNSIVKKEDAERKSSNCNATNCPEIEDGKFYKCAFLLQARKIGAIPQDERDYISIDKIDKESLRNYRASFTPGCGYCKGRDMKQWESERVPAAFQLNKPRDYCKYTD